MAVIQSINTVKDFSIAQNTRRHFLSDLPPFHSCHVWPNVSSPQTPSPSRLNPYFEPNYQIKTNITPGSFPRPAISFHSGRHQVCRIFPPGAQRKLDLVKKCKINANSIGKRYAPRQYRNLRNICFALRKMSSLV